MGLSALTFVFKSLKPSRLRHSNKLWALITATAVPISLSIASISLKCTILVFFTVAVSMFFMRSCILNPQHRENSQILIVWLSSSVLTLMIFFHVFVISLLEILPEENFFLLLFAVASIACLYNAKQKAHQIMQTSKATYSDDIEATSDDKHSLMAGTSPYYCNICQANIPNRCGHCLWLDCCIGSDNKAFFTLGVFLGMLALFYGANLSLTTVCHPFIVFKTILLPNDCSDVYFQFKTAISFVSGIYSLIMGVSILLYFIVEVIKKIANLSDHNLEHHGSNKKWQSGLMSFFVSRAVPYN